MKIMTEEFRMCNYESAVKFLDAKISKKMTHLLHAHT